MSWIKHVDDSTGREYWYSQETFESRWTDPEEVCEVKEDKVGEESDEEKAEYLFTKYDEDEDGKWLEAEVTKAVPSLNQEAYEMRCSHLKVPSSEGWTRQDVIDMYMNEPGRRSLKSDYKSAKQEKIPEAVMIAAGAAPPPIVVDSFPPPQTRQNLMISGSTRAPAKRKMNSKKKKSSKDVLETPLKEDLTCSEELINYYDALLLQNFVQQEQLKHITLSALTQASMAHCHPHPHPQQIDQCKRKFKKQSMPAPTIAALAASDHAIVPLAP